jgi:YggT family protein
MLFGIPADHGILYGIIVYITAILLIAMLIRAIASWLRVGERYAFIRFLAKMTDPFIAPMRRLIPPIGVLDVSFIIAFFLLFTLEILLTQALPLGW